MRGKKIVSVGSRELKTRLGTYLARVRKGETIVVTDRGEPVAELRPLEPTTDATEVVWRQMEAEGLVTLPTRTGPLPPFEPLRLPPGVSLSGVVTQERDSGW